MKGLELAAGLAWGGLLRNMPACLARCPYKRRPAPRGPRLCASCRVPALSDWALMLGWAQQGKAEAHFGEAGVTNLLHTLRDALTKATGAPLLGSAHDARKGTSRERQQAQAAARQDATLALMKELPPLLRRLQTDPAQARCWLRTEEVALRPGLRPPSTAAVTALMPSSCLPIFSPSLHRRPPPWWASSPR